MDSEVDNITYFVKCRRRNRDGIEIFDVVNSNGKVMSLSRTGVISLSRANTVVGVSGDKIIDKNQECKKFIEQLYLHLEHLKFDEVNFFCYRNGPVRDPFHILNCMCYVSNAGKENKFTFRLLSKFKSIEDMQTIYAHITQRYSSDSLESSNINEIGKYISSHLYNLKDTNK